MIIEDVDINAKVEKRDRNWRIEIFSDLERGMNILIRVHREVILVKDGSRWDTAGANGERKYMVEKLLAEIAADTVVLVDGTKLTGAQIAEGLELLSDLHRETEPSPPKNP